MGKQTWADNVDANGTAYDTVGDNIREGAKDAESVVKALQSPDITFDMQAIMNVLPFMDSTKKIEKYTAINNGSRWVGNGLNTGIDFAYTTKKTYAIIIGYINRINANAVSTRPLITKSNDNVGMGITFAESINNPDSSGTSIEFYAVVDK